MTLSLKPTSMHLTKHTKLEHQNDKLISISLLIAQINCIQKRTKTLPFNPCAFGMQSDSPLDIGCPILQFRDEFYNIKGLIYKIIHTSR
jgi:hypothetical protein